MNNRKQLYKQLTKVIKNHDVIYLFRHQRPDPDALGSSFGLKEIIKDNFENKKIFNLGEKSHELEHLFPKLNKIDSIKGENTLAIITDTANSPRINSELWRDCDFSIRIDHHPKIEDYSNLSLVFDDTIATCEIITEWAQEEKLLISKKAAEYLYTGILTDSGRFLYPNTTFKTFELTAHLLKTGIDMVKLHSKLYTRSLESGKFQAHILTNSIINKKIGHMYVSKKALAKFNISIESAKLNVNSLAGFEEVDIWLLAIQDEDIIRVSVRSKPKYAINKVAAKFNGGGHKNACGVKVKTVKELNELIKALEKIIK